MRTANFILGLLTAATIPTHAQQSLAGAWEGVTTGNRILILLDSSAAGWRARIHVAVAGKDTFPVTLPRITGDSVVLPLPPQLGLGTLHGALSPNGLQLIGWIITGTDSSGRWRVARAGSPTAAMLLAQLFRPPPSPKHVVSDPDSARLVTEDIPRFWAVVDRVPVDSLEEALQRDYLAPGTRGLMDFIPGRIISAADLAARVRAERARYLAARPVMARIHEAEPGIRAVYREMKRRYPETVYPDVYFIVGRFNSGGTASNAGLLIGAEMIRDPAGLPGLVAHELIHFQQPSSLDRRLLAQSFREGAADFLGEMISGVPDRSPKMVYGLAHEAELWKEFQEKMMGFNYTGWLYGKPPGERPADLGYFIGYRIARAYYEKALDKRAAIGAIIAGSSVDSLLARSGYDGKAVRR